ncbi:unnamed protein product [Lactuca virosa]|uniref:Uncharacterized protein n=1 Tax=Lactuca virosa TaxID=75947 RepID=A0AAU9P0G6_9ASTR|nr:unnamed protein product [Lactuca virosa]
MVEAEVALDANPKRCGSYDMPSGTGRTVVGQPLVGVGGSKDPGPVVTGTPAQQAWLWIPGMVTQPYDLVTLEPTRVVETLKNLTARFHDYRVVDVVNLLPTANDGTIRHLYIQM